MIQGHLDLSVGTPADRMAVIGLGTVGSITAELCASSGISVIGFDTDPAVVSDVERSLLGVSPLFKATSNPDDIASAKVLFVSVPGTPSCLQEVATLMTSFARACELIVIQSTVLPGTTRKFAQEWLPQRLGDRVCYCPERLRAGQTVDQVREMPRLIGAGDDDSLLMGIRTLARIGLNPVPVSSTEVAELAKLMENAFLCTGISFVAEISRIAHALNVSAQEVAEAAATKRHGYHPFYPGPSFGGSCLPNDLSTLRETGRQLGIQTLLLDAVHEVNETVDEEIVRYLTRALAARGARLRGSRIAIVGVGFKAGSSDVTNCASQRLVRLLRAIECQVCYLDSLVEHFEVDGRLVPRCRQLNDQAVNAAIILSGDAAVSIQSLCDAAEVVLDVGGAHIMPGIDERLQVL